MTFTRNIKNPLSLLMALIFAAGMLASCSQNSGDSMSDNSGLNEETIESEETEPDTTEKLLPDLPEGLDLEGYTLRLLFTKKLDQTEWGVDGIEAEEESGEPINDAAFRRNTYCEDKYSFKIEMYPYSQSEMNSEFYKKSIMAGSGDYDFMIMQQTHLRSLIEGGYLIDFNTVPYIDYDKPWWDVQIRDQLTIQGKTFGAFGDFIVTANNALRIILFNKGLIAEYSLDDPYNLVRDGEWTLDVFSAMYQGVKSDINGDGIMDHNDRYGYIGGIDMNMFFGSGENITSIDESGNPVLSVGGERSIAVLQKLYDMLEKSGDANITAKAYSKIYPGQEWLGLQDSFEANNGLFFTEVLQLAERMRAAEVEFGIIPIPKFDEAQQDYYAFSDSWCMNEMVIPITNLSLERTGQILELLNAESYYTVRPAYYDKSLTGKFLRDDESAGMLDIILAHKVICLDEMFGWGMYSSLNGAFSKGNFVSVITSGTKRIQKLIDKTITAISKAE